MEAVELRGITKRFGAVLANDHIDFHLQPGEIHALLGENGAGKTTLMRILYGLYTADEGQILVNGSQAHIRSPRDAIRSRIGMVTQHFTLVPPLSVAENVVLGYTQGFALNPKALQARVGEAAARYSIQVDPKALVRHLSVGERQRVEILKSLYRDARVLILDEPTAVLVPQEVEGLFKILARLRQEGMALVFISHKLYEVMEISDRISVLRDGRLVGTVEKAATSEAELARMMVGRESFGVTRQSEKQPGEPLLSVSGLCAVDKKGLPALKDVNLEVRGGEILGIAGVSGNGQAELSQVLSGTLKPSAGSVRIEGKDLTGASPADYAAANVGRVPEDRHGGVVGELTVAENLVLEKLEDYTRNGLLDGKAIQQNAERLIADYQIKAAPKDRIRTLSGGNMQKVLMARALSLRPRVLIVAQPTRGLDIGATDYVRSKLLEQRSAGTAVLMISEDLDEVIALADRIAVIYEGRIVGVVRTREANVEQLGLMMSGALEVTLLKLRIERRPAPLWVRPLIPVAGVLATFLLTTILVLAAGANPFHAFYYFLIAPLSDSVSAVEVLVKATPLLLTGAAVTFAFSAGYWNIGAEGQFLAGAIAAAGMGMALKDTPPVLAIPVEILAGFAAGMAWASIPALLKVRLAVDEVVTTLLMNTVILFFISFLLNGVWRSPISGWPQSPEIAGSAVFPRLIPQSRLHLGFLLAWLAIGAIWLVLQRTPLGLRMRAVGLGREAAQFSGVKVNRTMLTAALVSGGIAGLAGVSEVCGIHYHLIEAISAGYGYTGIIVAMLGGLNPIGVSLAGLFIGLIETGAQSLSRALSVPIYLGNVVEAALLLVTLSAMVLQNYRIRRA